ncbi:MAG: hypothetical protein AD073_000032 [Mycoplasmataceae bacterium]|nr:MAG: hypothetical protein AD073_000032 [Mycoplasmataceae bacterium]
MTNYIRNLKIRVKLLRESIESLKISNERFWSIKKTMLIDELEIILESNEKALFITTNYHND